MSLQFLICALYMSLLLHLTGNAQLVPDSSFATNGYFITNYPGLGTFTIRVHELSNGDILAMGSSEGKLRIWKYNQSGQLITSFGNAGIASNPSLDNALGNMDFLLDYEIYDNGKIMILSRLHWYHPSNYDSSTISIVLSSFNGDGSINTNFNSTGYRIDKPDPSFEFNAYSLLMNKNDGHSIYVGGEAYEKGHSTCPAGYGKWFISKYTSNGSTDLSFNGGGLLLQNAQVLALGTTVQYPHGRLRDLAFMPNGSVRAVGVFHNFDKSFFDFVITPNGSFDNTFGNGGKTKLDVTFGVPFLEVGTYAKILSDGSVLFYTTHGSGTGSSVKFLKHKANGSIDSSFGINGISDVLIPTQNNYRLIYKSDNSILLTYYKTYGSDQKIEFLRINANGLVDSSFGSNGLLLTQPIAPDVYINASSVMDGSWNNSETAIFLAAAKQPVSYSNFGIFKYKWPGIWPLSIHEITVDMEPLAYPNPITKGNLLYLNNVNTGSNFMLHTINGQEVRLQTESIQAFEAAIRIPVNITNGVYVLSIISDKGLKRKRIPISVQ